MCCFTQPVLSVNNTQIFARFNGNGQQYLAYQMSYESRQRNAMILPVPVQQPANDRTLRFIDLQAYDNFFDDLADGFPVEPSFSLGCSAPFDPAAGGYLEVFEVGNYIASFVPTLSDFSGLDPQFTLSDDVWSRLPRYQDFGFAVFQLAAGAVRPHPMAFHFVTASDELFFPTVHIHDGEVHETEEFDHILYMQHAGLDSSVFGYENSNVEDKATGLIRSKYLASEFCDLQKAAGMVDGDLLVHRKVLFGDLPNSDTSVAVAGDPIVPSLNLRPWLSYSPWLIAVPALGWFLNRRAKMKKIRNSGMGPVNEGNAT